MTPKQLAVLLRESASHRLHTVYVLAVGTGMRMGEMFGLQWPDVDMKKGVINVRRRLTDSHVLPNMQQEAAEKLDGILRAAAPEQRKGERGK